MGGKLCRSKFCAASRALSITRLEFMKSEYSVFDALDFEIQTIADLAPITGAGGQ
jgi:hypothetical protein